MLRQYLKSLADKFREVLDMGDYETINAQYFTDAIGEVYEAGKQAGGGSSDDTKFWDMLTDFGNKTLYSYTFYGARLVDTNGKVLFTPKYDMYLTGASAMFEGAKGSIDLQAQFEKAGKVLDFSNSTSINRCFYLSEITRVGIVDCAKATNISALFGNSKIRKIDGIVFYKTMNYNVASMFLGCTELTEVTAYGELATSGLDLSSCPLTHDSIMSFINILEQTSTTKTITFGTENLAKLSNEEKAIATQKGWTLA
jgi:hypothetical protein